MTTERVHDIESRALEVAHVAGRHGEAMHESSRRDQAVFDRHGASGRAKAGEQLGPTEARLRFPGQAVQAPHPLIEPALESRPPPSAGKHEHAESDLAEDHRIDDDRILVTPQPVDGGRRGIRPGRLAKDVGVDEVLQRESVDSDLIGRKKPFSGQASSQSTTPRLGREARRTRR